MAEDDDSKLFDYPIAGKSAGENEKDSILIQESMFLNTTTY